MIQKARIENANIIFGAVIDNNMKDAVKITVIAAGFQGREEERGTTAEAIVLAATWKAGRRA